MTTLTTNYRPTMFSDMVAQQHIIGQNGILTRSHVSFMDHPEQARQPQP